MGAAVWVVRPEAGHEHLMRAALGLRAHSGWAALVAVGGSVQEPVVIDRRRISLAESGGWKTFQPYHAAQRMRLEEADAFITGCAETGRVMARTALRNALDKFAGDGYEIGGACILWGSGGAPIELAAILASHSRVHTAEGEFYREAVRSACEFCGVRVSIVKERELLTRSAATLGISTGEAERRSSTMGKSIGPPWRQDEKLCALAGWLGLTAW